MAEEAVKNVASKPKMPASSGPVRRTERSGGGQLGRAAVFQNLPKSKFVYVTYIATTVERLWNALLDAEFTRQYWGQDNVSDWRPGSKWEHRRGDDSGTVLIVG